MFKGKIRGTRNKRAFRSASKIRGKLNNVVTLKRGGPRI